jgi:hypothetical protein
MTSLNLLDTQRLIWTPFRSFRVKRRQNYLYYKHATLLKIALFFFCTQSEIVRHSQWHHGEYDGPNQAVIEAINLPSTEMPFRQETVQFVSNYFFISLLKWRILSQPAKIGSGKNKKSLFFLLGLKITLRTCFESNNFLSNSCPELSNQVLSFSEGQIY